MASMLFERQEWVTGRHPETVARLRRMREGGADSCSACAGALLLAETGLLDGMASTTHWAFAPTFRRNVPTIDLNVGELASKAGMSRPSFNRRFKRATGYTPIRCRQHLRVEQAERLLEPSDAPIDEICTRVGYDEAGAFRRARSGGCSTG